MPCGRLNSTSRQTPVTTIDGTISTSRATHKICDKRVTFLLVGASFTGLAVIAVGALFTWFSVTGRLTKSARSENNSAVGQSGNETRSDRQAMAVVRQSTESVTMTDSVDYALIVDTDGFTTFVRKNSNKIDTFPSTPAAIYCDRRIQFRCNNSTCVHIKLRCNKRRDCPNGEDEDNCTCVDYLSTISPKKICDGYPDCRASEDEQSCSNNCASDEYRCMINGVCIKNERLCDDVNDCADAADESQCWSLAPSIDALLDRDNMQIYEYGFLFGRKKGVWMPVCVDSNLSSVVASDFCTKIGFKNLLLSKTKSFQQTLNKAADYLRIKILHSSSNSSLTLLTDVSPMCSSGTVADLACDTFLTCGQTPFCKPPTKRIVGGGSTGPYCHPWAVALYRDGELTCQAVVLTNRWLLTAAHCFTENLNRRWTARLGFYRQYSQSPVEEIRQVERVVSHPNYTNTPVETNDIALIKLSRPVKFGYHIQPPCLPLSADEKPSDDDKCTVVGWGFIDEKSTNQVVDELQSVDLTVIDVDECNRSGEFKGKISDGHLCLGHGSEKKDACQGDSGGPLLCRRSNGGQLYLAGITSTGYGCARPGVPSIWTRVGRYLGWIQSVIAVGTQPVASQVVQNPSCQGFACRYGDCVYRYFQCDHQWNCLLDGEDELSCLKDRYVCESPRVRCNADRSCIAPYKLCDYVADCPDGEDEKFCGCASSDSLCSNAAGCAPNFYQEFLKLSHNLTTSMDKFC